MSKQTNIRKVEAGFYEVKTQEGTYYIESGKRAGLRNPKEWLISYEDPNLGHTVRVETVDSLKTAKQNLMN